MSFKLMVSRETEPFRQDEYVFEQEAVIIGRDTTNDLTLPDPQRITSKQHAKVERQGDTFYLTDLGSKNQTFLNNRRLDPHRPYALQNGDQFKIGEFLLQLLVVETVSAPPEADRTVFGPGFVNPFNEDANTLAEAIKRLQKAYAHEPPSRRGDALREALEDALFGVERGEAGRMLAGVLYPETGAPPLAPAPSPQPAHTPAARPRTAASADPGASARSVQVIDLLLDAAIRLVKGVWQFRLEFMGQTIVETPGVFALHAATTEEAKAFLLDPMVPQDEMNRRLVQLEHAVNDVLVHQIALLDGYKAGIKEGAEQLLEQFDPDRLEQEVGHTGPKLGPLNLPFGGKDKLLERIRQRYQELLAEHRGAFEKRLFRPAFIRAYLRTTAAARQD